MIRDVPFSKKFGQCQQFKLRSPEMWLPSFSAIMIALAVHDMFWRLWGMFATDVEQFLWGSKLVSALMIVLFYFCFCSLSSGIRSESQGFVLQPSPEHSPYHLVGVWRGDPDQITWEWGLTVVGKGGSLDLAEYLHSFCDLPTASVSDSSDGCIMHFFSFSW